jgi:hypothetical protein
MINLLFFCDSVVIEILLMHRSLEAYSIARDRLLMQIFLEIVSIQNWVYNKSSQLVSYFGYFFTLRIFDRKGKPSKNITKFTTTKLSFLFIHSYDSNVNSLFK